jgi:hypothetical protein
MDVVAGVIGIAAVLLGDDLGDAGGGLRCAPLDRGG